MYDFESAKMELKAGENVKVIFNRLAEWMEWHKEHVNDIRSAFRLLRKCGLPQEDVRKWIEDNKTDELMHDIEVENIDAWRSIGIEAADYIEDFMDSYSRLYFDRLRLEDLPPYVTMDMLLEWYRIENIIEMTKNYGFNCFIEEYIAAGGDIKKLAEKFYTEIGYQHEYRDQIYDLIYAGAPVDIEKFAACLEFDKMNEDDIKFFHETVTEVESRK